MRLLAKTPTHSRACTALQEHKLALFAHEVEAQHQSNVARQQQLNSAASLLTENRPTSTTQAAPVVAFELSAEQDTAKKERPSSSAGRLRRSLTSSLFTAKRNTETCVSREPPYP